MKALFRCSFVLILLSISLIVQAQDSSTVPQVQALGVVVALLVLGVMAFLLFGFVRQLWQEAKTERSQAPTEKLPPVEAKSLEAQAQSPSSYLPSPAELGNAPTMILELIKAPSGILREGQQWFITQNRTPFLIGSGTSDNQALDILVSDKYVSAIHVQIEFEAESQRFVVLDAASDEGSTWNEAAMPAKQRFSVPQEKVALLEIAHRYVFRLQQVKGNAASPEHEALPSLNIAEDDATSKMPPTEEPAFEVPTSKLPDVEELKLEPFTKSSTGEVETLQEAPDMSTLPNVRYPLQNVEYPPLMRLPNNVDAMIEVVRSPNAQATAYTISRTVYHIGRSDKTDLRLPDAMISNNHVSLYWAKSRFWVVDTSLNKTWLRSKQSEKVLERGNPIVLDAGQEYFLTIARDENVLRFRYSIDTAERDSQEATLPPLPADVKVTLKMLRVGDTDELKEFDVSSNRISIGRDSTNMVKLEPQVVSRRHAELVWRADAYYLQDKRSLFGVQVDTTILPNGGEERLEANQVYRILLSPKQKDVVVLEFSYTKN